MVIRTFTLCCLLALTSTSMAQETQESTGAAVPNAGAAEPAPASVSTAQPAEPLAAPSAATATPRTASTPTSVATTLEDDAVDDDVVDDDVVEEEAEDEDSYGVMYIRLQGGLSYVNLLSFNQDNFIPEAEESSGVGPFGGLAVGFRVYWFSVGASASFGRQGGFDLGTVGAELAFHIPIPTVQPYVRLAAGYAWVGRYDFQNQELAETDIFGLTVEAGAGIDIKLARHLSIGAGFDAAFLNLTRQEIGSVNVTGVDLEETGDALGFQLRAHAHLTIHI